MEVPRFSIGTYTKKKERRKIPAPRDNFTTPCKMNIYSGNRWNFPCGIHASDSIKYKFSLLDTNYNFTNIKEIISNRISNMRFNILAHTNWKAPRPISNIIRSYYGKQEHEWNKVRKIYFKLFKLKRLFINLLYKIRVNHALKNCKNTDDPVTFDIPKKPVIVIDIVKRISFVYDANSLRRTIENRLLYSDYMFPEPKVPLNILTNEPFTPAQFYSIVNQCKKHGEYSWMLDSLSSLEFDLGKFTVFNQQRLKIESIKSFFNKSTFVIRDIVLEYFYAEAYNTQLPEKHIQLFVNTYVSRPDTPIVRLWINHTREYYIAKELQNLTMLKDVILNAHYLINRIYKYYL